jgi:predicted permease
MISSLDGEDDASLFGSSVYTTLVASLKSIGTACTLAGVGVYLQYFGYVSNDGKRTLALISQQVTFPLYLFTKILYCNQDWSETKCPDVTQTLQQVWILLLWPLYVVGTGMYVFLYK